MQRLSKRWRWFLGAVALIVVAMIVAILALQRLVLFPRGFIQADPEAAQRVRGLMSPFVENEDGRVEAWFVPGEGASADNPRPAVIFAHGNGEVIDHWPELLARYRELGISLLLPEYRGYGRSAGSPSEEGIVADYVRFYDWLAARPDVDRNVIIFHGRSLGGGVVSGLARHRPPAAMILMSTFTSVSDVAREKFFVPRWLIRDRFDNVEALAALDRPILIVHGRRDGLIAPSHAERLARDLRRVDLVWYDAGHNDCPPDWPVFWNDVERFLRENGLL